jgi:hypothetical protein
LSRTIRPTSRLQGLQELGRTDGSNVRIGSRWSAGDAGRIRGYAVELVALVPLASNLRVDISRDEYAFA